MNNEPRNSNIPGLLLLVLFALALVAACSGDNSSLVWLGETRP